MPVETDPFHHPLVCSLGWSSVFFIFGTLGVGWFVLWVKTASSGPTEDPAVDAEERDFIVANTCDQVCVAAHLPALSGCPP